MNQYKNTKYLFFPKLFILHVITVYLTKEGGQVKTKLAKLFVIS